MVKEMLVVLLFKIDNINGLLMQQELNRSINQKILEWFK